MRGLGKYLPKDLFEATFQTTSGSVIGVWLIKVFTAILGLITGMLGLMKFGVLQK